MVDLGLLAAILAVTGEFGGNIVHSPKLWTVMIAFGHLALALKLIGRGPRW